MAHRTMGQAGNVLRVRSSSVAPGQTHLLGVSEHVGRAPLDLLVATCAVAAHDAKQAAPRGVLRDSVLAQSARGVGPP